MVPWKRSQSRSVVHNALRNVPGGALIAHGVDLAGRMANAYAPPAGLAGAVGAAGAAVGAEMYRRRKKRARAVNLAPGSMGGRIIKKRKRVRPPRGTVRKIRFTKAQRKSIKRIANVDGWHNLGDWLRNGMGQLVSAVNKVSWGTLSGASDANWLSLLQNEQILTASDGVSTSVTQEPADLVSLQSGQKQYKVIRKLKYIFKNNSNAPAELTIYKARCTDNTTTSPLQDIDARVSATYFTVTTTSTSTPSAPLAKEDNFQQYWSTPVMRESKWKIITNDKMIVAGGDEVTFYSTLVIPIQLRNQVTTDYFKGQEYLFYRIMGRPSHDSTEAQFGNLGISDTRVDYLEMYVTSAYSKKEANVQANHRTLANSQFTAIVPVVAGDAVVEPVQDN